SARSHGYRMVALIAAIVILLGGSASAFLLKRKSKPVDEGVKTERTEKRDTAKKIEPVEMIVEEPPAAPVVPKITEYQAGLTSQQIRSGRNVYNWKCYDCHQYYDPAVYNDEQWNSIIEKMRGKAKLTPAEFTD